MNAPPRSPIAEEAARRADWFWADFLPDWLDRVQDPEGGVHDLLDQDGVPQAAGPRTVLAQARTLFVLSHLALLSGDPALTGMAARQRQFLARLRKAPGLYRLKGTPSGAPTDDPSDAQARSYDQTFVILALSTWNRLSLSPDCEPEIEACWQALTTTLTDPATGLLLEHDGLADPAAPEAPPRAQNPHMHLYEACLQAFEMSGRAEWLQRAQAVRATALRHFLDPDSGTVAEFLTPGLQPLPGAAGLRREVGHQCEWAWLLMREVELGGDPATNGIAARLLGFASRHGFAGSGPMAGACFDAVSAKGGVMEESFLLWPQTEAIKAHAMRHIAGEPGAGEAAQQLLCLMFRRWFDGRPAYVNQLGPQAETLQPQALTRLMYHVVLALTEGVRARLWPGMDRTGN